MFFCLYPIRFWEMMKTGKRATLHSFVDSPTSLTSVFTIPHRADFPGCRKFELRSSHAVWIMNVDFTVPEANFLRALNDEIVQKCFRNWLGQEDDADLCWFRFRKWIFGYDGCKLCCVSDNDVDLLSHLLMQSLFKFFSYFSFGERTLEQHIAALNIGAHVCKTEVNAEG